MCGRLTELTPPDRLAEIFQAELGSDLDPAGWPHWNVGPTSPVPAIAPTNRLDQYRWGLARDGAPMFNARGESLRTKPAFRRRVVVLADGFFEWRPGTGQPYYFTRADRWPMAFAGVADGRSCAIVTAPAGADMDGIHDRMPVVLEPGEREIWLEPDGVEPEELLGLLRPAAKGTLVHHAVDRRVGSVRNDDPGLIEPAPEVEVQRFSFG